MLEYGYFIHQWDLHLGDLIEFTYVRRTVTARGLINKNWTTTDPSNWWRFVFRYPPITEGLNSARMDAPFCSPGNTEYFLVALHGLSRNPALVSRRISFRSLLYLHSISKDLGLHHPREMYQEIRARNHLSCNPLRIRYHYPRSSAKDHLVVANVAKEEVGCLVYLLARHLVSISRSTRLSPENKYWLET